MQNTINNNTYMTISNLIQPYTKEEENLLICCNNYIQELPDLVRDFALLQLKRVLVETILMVSKDETHPFSTKTRDLFLIKQFIINYYSNLHRGMTSVKTIQIEAPIEQILKIGKSDIEINKMLQAMETDGSSSFNLKITAEEKDTPSFRSHMAKLFIENYQDGTDKITRAIINNGSYQRFINTMNLLQLYEKHMLNHIPLKEYIKKRTNV